MKIIFLIIFLFSNVYAQNAIQEEQAYLHFKQNILLGNHEEMFFSADQKLFIDALEDLMVEHPTQIKEKLSNIQTFNLSIIERLRVEILKMTYENPYLPDNDFFNQLALELTQPEVSKRLILILASHQTLFEQEALAEILKLAKMHPSFYEINQLSNKSNLNQSMIKDLFDFEPKPIGDLNQAYEKGIKIFMFCRFNRSYPCLMILKDHENNEVRTENGSLWARPALASAVTGFPSHQRNGHTPAGVYTIDSVMPLADQNQSFGKFRRLILNFIPESKSENLLKSFLPKSSWSNSWWRPSVVARDIGRNLLRIHGTGKMNPNEASTFFPFVQTHGCIAQRENTYNKVTYIDQRILLDSLMKALALDPIYQNEVKIKGILYVIDVDQTPRSFELSDLKEHFIE
jgi:hypothetical protein